MKIVTVRVESDDPELSAAIKNIIATRFHGLNLKVSTSVPDQTIHVSNILIANKNDKEEIHVKIT